MRTFSSTGVVYGFLRGSQAAEQQLVTPTEVSKRLGELSKTCSNPVAFMHIKFSINCLVEFSKTRSNSVAFMHIKFCVH